MQFTLILRFRDLSIIQAVSFRNITARVRSKNIPCGICGLQSGSVTRFPPSTSALSSLIIPLVLLSSLYLHVVLTRRTNGSNLVTFKQNNAVPEEGEEI